jgi:hypothetical protein
VHALVDDLGWTKAAGTLCLVAVNVRLASFVLRGVLQRRPLVSSFRTRDAWFGVFALGLTLNWLEDACLAGPHVTLGTVAFWCGLVGLVCSPILLFGERSGYYYVVGATVPAFRSALEAALRVFGLATEEIPTERAGLDPLHRRPAVVLRVPSEGFDLRIGVGASGLASFGTSQAGGRLRAQELAGRMTEYFAAHKVETDLGTFATLAVIPGVFVAAAGALAVWRLAHG